MADSPAQVRNWQTHRLEQTAELERNWEALRARQLRLLPVPKHIQFTDQPVVVQGPGSRPVAIVLSEETENGRLAAQEIVSRLKELAPAIGVAE